MEYAKIFRRSAHPAAVAPGVNSVASRIVAHVAQSNREKPGRAAIGQG